MGEVVYRSTVTIHRENPPIRRADIAVSGESVTFGVPGEVGEHYGVSSDHPATRHAGTIEYIIAAAGG
jgi:hypothetical protein